SRSLTSSTNSSKPLMRRLNGMAFRLAIGGSYREPAPIDIRMQISTGLSIACGASLSCSRRLGRLPCRGGNLERTFVSVVVLRVQDVDRGGVYASPIARGSGLGS